MSKKYDVKRDCMYSMDFDRHLVECEEGEYITKTLNVEGVRNVYIYSTLADVYVVPSEEDKITATLHSDFIGSTKYFDVFRLSEDMLYIFATCDAQSIEKYKLFVSLPESTTYNIQIVTSYGEATVYHKVLFNKLKLEVGKGLLPRGEES